MALDLSTPLPNYLLKRITCDGGPEGTGWLSGTAMKYLALKIVFDLYREMPNVLILGVGGISTGGNTMEMIIAGASAVQVCTAAILQGHEISGKIDKFL